VVEPSGTRSESMLTHMMAGGLRRWVLYEWLYPAIDRPWFMKNELQVGVKLCGGCDDVGCAFSEFQRIVCPHAC
jgi:hypothetical protein